MLVWCGEIYRLECAEVGDQARARIWISSLLNSKNIQKLPSTLIKLDIIKVNTWRLVLKKTVFLRGRVRWTWVWSTRLIWYVCRLWDMVPYPTGDKHTISTLLIKPIIKVDESSREMIVEETHLNCYRPSFSFEPNVRFKLSARCQLSGLIVFVITLTDWEWKLWGERILTHKSWNNVFANSKSHYVVRTILKLV